MTSILSLFNEFCTLLCGCQCGYRTTFRLGPISEQKGDEPKGETVVQKIDKRGVTMAFEMTATQKVLVSVAFTDVKGNPARVDGVPEWATDNSDVLSIVPAADGLSCEVLAVGVVGTGNVQVRADADMGVGVVPVIGILEVSITAGPASVVALTPGTAEEQ